MDRTITQVNFTYACPDGMWIRRADGTSTWMHFDSLLKEVGASELARLHKIAHHNGWTGMWYNARNGGNVYANGREVNA
jgi:hypothetical protein